MGLQPSHILRIHGTAHKIKIASSKVELMIESISNTRMFQEGVIFLVYYYMGLKIHQNKSVILKLISIYCSNICWILIIKSGIVASLHMLKNIDVEFFFIAIVYHFCFFVFLYSSRTFSYLVTCMQYSCNIRTPQYFHLKHNYCFIQSQQFWNTKYSFCKNVYYIIVQTSYNYPYNLQSPSLRIL